MVSKLTVSNIDQNLPQWSNNFQQNLFRIKSTNLLSTLYNRHLNQPAIVVTPGPGLDKNIYLLKRFKHRFKIICSDMALSALLARGIIPDYVVTVDGGNQIKELYRYHYETVNIALIAIAHISPEVLSMFRGREYFYHIPINRSQYVELVNQVPGLTKVPGGGSVTHTALYSALFMGCQPIVLLGFNFAFDNYRYYARGTYFDRLYGAEDEQTFQKMLKGEYLWKGLVPQKNLLSLSNLPEEYIANLAGLDRIHFEACRSACDATVHSSKVPTSTKMIFFRKCVQNLIDQFKEQRTIINSTEGGILSEGENSSFESLPFIQAVYHYGLNHQELSLYQEARRELAKNVDRGAEKLDQLYQSSPDLVDLPLMVAMAYKDKGNPEKFRKYLEKIIAENPYLPESYLMAGKYYLEQGMTSEALASFRRCLEIEPDFYPVYKHLGFLLIEEYAEYAFGVDCLCRYLQCCHKFEERKAINQLIGKINQMFRNSDPVA